MDARPGSEDALIRLRSATFAYGAIPVLTDVDLAVRPGDLVGVVGPSGAGKTTLLRILAGTLTPQVGIVERRPGLRLGWVPQVESVNWHFPVTVDEVVLMGNTPVRRTPWYGEDEREKVHRLLHDLGIGHMEGRHIRQLSGGQQQRVFVARALVSDPDVILLDEPMSGVDVKTRQDVLALLYRLAASGIAVVLSTHDLNSVAAHLPEVVAVNGRVVATGSPEEVFTRDVLRETFGADMDVIHHQGHPVVLDRHDETVTHLLPRRERG